METVLGSRGRSYQISLRRPRTGVIDSLGVSLPGHEVWVLFTPSTSGVCRWGDLGFFDVLEDVQGLVRPQCSRRTSS